MVSLWPATVLGGRDVAVLGFELAFWVGVSAAGYNRGWVQGGKEVAGGRGHGEWGGAKVRFGGGRRGGSVVDGRYWAGSADK